MELDLDIFLKPSDKWDREYLKAVAAAIRQYKPDNAGKIIQRYLSEEQPGRIECNQHLCAPDISPRIIEGRRKFGGSPFSKRRHRHVVFHCSP